jgi:protein ImuB
MSARLLRAPLTAPATGPADRGAPLHAVVRSALAAPTASPLWAAVHLPGFDSAQKLEQLAVSAQRFTPRVSLVPPDGLLLEVRGSLHLFAGLEGLRTELLHECLRHEVQALLAFAPTPLAALTAARAGKSPVITELAQLIGQLAPLPLSALRWPEETVLRLSRMGVCTIGGVLRLPRAGFARRFGAAQLTLLDRLTGRAPDLRASFHARERFRRRRELDYEIRDHGRLLEALAPLFTALARFLTARHSGVEQLECRLLHRYAPATHCMLLLAAACSDAKRLAELFGERLNTLVLPEPVRACELRAQAPVAHLPGSGSLWQPGEQGGDAAALSGDLIERLRARLGSEAVQGLALREGHRPECAWTVTEPAAATARAAVSAVSEPQAAARRPLWILPAPQPLEVRDGLPRRAGALRLVSEPERIESGWWDGGDIARDYYSALDSHGVRLWVFRDRSAPHGWFLHGIFG